VERELYEDLPDHRPLQRAYLTRQVEDIEQHLSAEIEGIAPSRVYAATSAMNVVLAEEAAEIAERPISPLVRSSLHRAMGIRLRQILRDEKTPGYHGDRAITNAWVETHTMRDWYEWYRRWDLQRCRRSGDQIGRRRGTRRMYAGRP
jgi:hypothetical protein